MGTVNKKICVLFFALIVSASLVLTVQAGDDFEAFLKSETESFQSYKDERDKEFVGFLKAQWQEFQAHKGLVRDKKPKPVVMPVAKEKPAPSEPEVSRIVKLVRLPEQPVEEPVKELVPEPVETVVPEAVVPVQPPVETVAPEVGVPVPALAVTFYNTPVRMNGTFDFPSEKIDSVTKDAIGAFWDGMSRSSYEGFLAQARKIRKDLRLNDWGYHSFLYRCGTTLYDGDRNMANLFVWFLSSKSGFNARIGYDSSSIYLLMPSRNRLFSVPYLTLKGRKYYGISFDSVPVRFKTIYTYKGHYAGAEKLMDYRLSASPALKEETLTRDLSFRHKGNDYLITARYNRNLVDYFRYYPQTNIKVYFDAVVSPETEYSLLSGLKGLVEGKTETEAVDLLLRFVQTSFAYKTDDANFGREKYMLPEETLNYPYSDCEDRSFFFAYLVRKLVGLDVVGLDYPGHISTAVRFSDNLSGDYIVRNNRKYMVCDPTYVNAGPGMAMPAFKRKKPEVVKITNR